MKYAILGFILGILTVIFSAVIFVWVSGYPVDFSDYDGSSFSLVYAILIVVIYMIVSTILGLIIERLGKKKSTI